jgi:Uma2 family endonuclease
MGSQPERKLDYAYYASLPSDGRRYEIIRGKLSVNPAPNPLHQRVSRRLLRQLADFYHGSGRGEVFDAPIDVILGPHDIVQPDLVVVASPAHITSRGIEAPPLLVVEILSPSTWNQDRGVKRERYAQLGVPNYWLVDADARRIECSALVHGAYVLIAEAHDDEVLRHEAWDGLEVYLEPLWRPSPARG